MRGWWWGLGVLVGCADAELGPEGADPVAPDPAADTEACLAALGDTPREAVFFSGGAVALEDGAEVGFAYAPQGGLYTPYVVRLWGHPELYLPSGYEGEGRVWARWSTTDPDGSYVLTEDDAGVSVTCVPGEDGESALELELHAQYFGEGGSTWDGMAPEALRDRPVTLHFAFGPHPEATGTAWGHPSYPTTSDEITIALEYTITLTEGVPL